MKPIEGFLLAAGLGTRMGPLSEALPKPAWTLRHQSLLQWGAGALRAEGITDLACNTHLLPESLREVARDIECFEEPQLLGSAGGLSHMRDRVGDALLSWNADVWAEHIPFAELKARHLAADAELSWLLIPHPGGPWTRVWLGTDGRVLPRAETGEGPFLFTGAACWSPSALARLPEGPSEVRDLLPRLHRHVGIVVEPFPWREVGTPDALIEAARDLAPQQEGRLADCYIHPSATVGGGNFHRCVFGPGAAPHPAMDDHDAFWFAQDGIQVRLQLPR